MKKILTGLVFCGLGLAVGCQGNTPSGSTTKKTEKNAGTSSKSTEVKPDEKKPDEKKPDEKKPDEKKPD